MKEKNVERLLYSSAGVAAMFVLLLAFYVVTSAFKTRLDLTAEKAYTLSPGTRNILRKLDSPVTIRFYCTQAGMPPELKPFAQEVEDLLNEYKQAAKGKIILEKLDPQPDSDAEDSARLDGIQGQQANPMGGDRIYLGLMVKRLDTKMALPWIDQGRERLLEYDVSRAISRVVTPDLPTIGLMSALPVFGQEANPMMQRMGQQSGAEPFVFVTELKKDFTVKDVPMTATKIDDDIKVLVVYHPRDITDDAQYAIDQFIMRGGKLIAFLDPHAYFDQKHDQMAQVLGESSGQSTLPKLLKAWGLDLDQNKVVADVSASLRNPQNGSAMPTVLLVTKANVDKDDIVTSQIDNLEFAFAGAFTGKPADGLKEVVLAQSTTQSELVEGMTATMGGEQIVRDFKASGVNYPLAVRLTGKFKTAFPEGKPKAAGETNAPDTNAVAGTQLKESPANNSVILVGDSDMLADQVCVRVQNFMGYRVAQPINGNLNLIQSCVEQMAGDSDLITLRSRGSLNRPFTRLQELEQKAGQQWNAKVKELQAAQQETERKISELQAAKQGGQQQFILSPQQQKELENFQKTSADTKKQMKDVQKKLRKDTDSLKAEIRVLNIAAMPVLVAVTGIVLSIVKRKRTAAK